MTEVNRQQAALPVCCEKVTNAIGTAPGMWFSRNGKVFVSMPGVPHEMKKMMTERVVPKLQEIFRPAAIHHRVIRTIGIGESFLADKISDWEQALPSHIKLAYLPGLGEVKLRLTGIGEDLSLLESETAALAVTLRDRVAEFIYGEGDDPLEVVLGRTLVARNLTISVAESCTGGYLSHLITSVPGSSAYFMGSMIPYSYEIKKQQLGVKPETLINFGAVSEETIREMATLVREKFNTDIGVATSGIAGPGGATSEKPVGTVWIAYSDKSQTVARKLQLSTERLLNIKYASLAALNLIRMHVPPHIPVQV
jgi:nicotinamide-nucleotide amidase